MLKTILNPLPDVELFSSNDFQMEYFTLSRRKSKCNSEQCNAISDVIQSGWPLCKNNYYIVFLSKTFYTDVASVNQPVKLVPKGAKI